MTTMLNPHTNGRKRPSLSEQINRLDGILDGLSDGLNDAVADAVKAAVGLAVKEAVQAVLKEVLANPVVLAKLQLPTAALAAESLPAPRRKSTMSERLGGWWQRARACPALLREGGRESLHRLRTFASDVWHKAIGPVTLLWTRREILWFFKGQILTALSIGLLMAVLACHAGPWIGTIVSGIGGFVTTLAIQANLWLQSLRSASADETV